MSALVTDDCAITGVEAARRPTNDIPAANAANFFCVVFISGSIPSIHRRQAPLGSLNGSAPARNPAKWTPFRPRHPWHGSAKGRAVRPKGRTCYDRRVIVMAVVKLHRTVGVRVGPVQVGGGAPVVVTATIIEHTPL